MLENIDLFHSFEPLYVSETKQNWKYLVSRKTGHLRTVKTYISLQLCANKSDFFEVCIDEKRDIALRRTA